MIETRKNNNYTRKCIITNQILDINKLTRFSLLKETQKVRLDLNKNLKGRGAYFEFTWENWEKVKKTKSLNRAFRFNVSPDDYLEIEKQLLEVINEQEKQQN
ncbi:YlxR family protein [Mycoplasmopsis columboralis]|uniref:Transciprtional termination factor n=1 Tax=Mycoplasmopsis columboralis TaxID=171282 RepID=A0A449B6V5_9BACT|nr:YlxR family protein [Mycoplasmopsis columboralis]VEU76347.1 Putative transciprtional termination factor [Mycoplasmopsis columboralis]